MKTPRSTRTIHIDGKLWSAIRSHLITKNTNVSEWTRGKYEKELEKNGYEKIGSEWKKKSK